MSKNCAFVSDGNEDIISIMNVDSEEDDTRCGGKPAERRTNINVPDIFNSNQGNVNITGINMQKKTQTPQITSVAFQNSNDITFGNKMLYNGPVTVNQYGRQETNFGECYGRIS